MPRRDDAGLAILHRRVRGGGLGKVVRQDRQRIDGAVLIVRGCPRGKFDQGIEAVARVGEYVTFRMPIRILRRAAQVPNFREVFDPPRLRQKREAARGRDTFGRSLEPLLAHALDCQLSISAADAATKLDGLGRGLEIEPGAELHAAQHAERIFCKRAARVSEHAALQILPAPEEIEEFARARIEQE